MLHIKMNSAKAGLENHTHIQYEQKHKINGICPLSEQWHYCEIYSVKEDNSCRKGYYVIYAVIFAVIEHGQQH
jgi:hypothetical protein